ncbi:hypothetical protein Tco_0433166 [Tanacetum coccineum]
MSDYKEEETEAQGRKTHDLDPLVSLVQELITPSKTVNASGEEQVEDVSPTTLEAAAILSRVKKINLPLKKLVLVALKFVLVLKKLILHVLDVNYYGIEFQLATDKHKSLITFPDLGWLRARINRDQRKGSSVQIEAQSYTKDDWTQNELEQAWSKFKKRRSVFGKDLTVEDYAKMKLENQRTWKLTQLKKLNFEEVKAEFEKLVKQLDTYVLINFEATKESLKRFGEELQTKTAKKLKFDDEGTQPIEEKVEEDKDDEPTKKTGKRRKQIARKGFYTHHDKDKIEDSDKANEKDDSTSGTKIPINLVPAATKSPNIANYKIIKQGRKGIYQIIRENGTNMVYISFGAMLTDISRDDLTELYRIVMRKHGMNEPEDEFEKNGDEEKPTLGEVLCLTQQMVHQSTMSNNIRTGLIQEQMALEWLSLYQKVDGTSKLTKYHEQRLLWLSTPWNLPYPRCQRIDYPEQTTATVEMVFSRPWTCTFLVAKGLATPELMANW